jgi:hypothetical protein
MRRHCLLMEAKPLREPGLLLMEAKPIVGVAGAKPLREPGLLLMEAKPT